ncbi:STM3941 family protein [Pedobacter suwonensis]|uniref:STM3941 family protein n=1 Tax=Pedobacter suwonensis TaxID=332999 RepID=UPI0025DE17DD|nr:STM3941 family protein [uncultured Pedobacter sp.]
MKDTAEISFKKSNIIISILLCVLGLGASIFLLFHAYLPAKIICLAGIILLLVILSERILQLKKSIKGEVALKLSKEGLINFMLVKTVSIPWNEIEDFHTGFYRTDSILVIVSNPAQYKTTAIKDYVSLIAYLNDIFSSKPYLLWIDIDMLDIKQAELLEILQQWKLHSA